MVPLRLPPPFPQNARATPLRSKRGKLTPPPDSFFLVPPCAFFPRGQIPYLPPPGRTLNDFFPRPPPGVFLMEATSTIHFFFPLNIVLAFLFSGPFRSFSWSFRVQKNTQCCALGCTLKPGFSCDPPQRSPSIVLLIRPPFFRRPPPPPLPGIPPFPPMRGISPPRPARGLFPPKQFFFFLPDKTRNFYRQVIKPPCILFFSASFRRSRAFLTPFFFIFRPLLLFESSAPRYPYFFLYVFFYPFRVLFPAESAVLFPGVFFFLTFFFCLFPPRPMKIPFDGTPFPPFFPSPSI